MRTGFEGGRVLQMFTIMAVHVCWNFEGARKRSARLNSAAVEPRTRGFRHRRRNDAESVRKIEKGPANRQVRISGDR
ncbi:Hypothetical protein NTJ_01293 [Nesidiocoris tenuis]|uniref:Secreted protein n=1 Tax=Nesidiocoris tenuis TaxID=355587 RepID=A0ABN7AB95_9HEMI|nr:Hypothetical protein NTJ_01293 [Nesidiocoris tenuis]